jgi:GH24 family phage-related lysozyme (muramidase)
MTKEQKKALALIKKYEGFRSKVYLDGNGIRTIGYGFTDPALIRKGKISQTEADARLLKEV